MALRQFLRGRPQSINRRILPVRAENVEASHSAGSADPSLQSADRETTHGR